MINPSNKKYSSTIYLSFLLSLSHANLRVCEVCINEGEHLPIYTNQVIDLLHDSDDLFPWLGLLLLERLQIHITWCHTRDYCPELQQRLYLKD